jgi:hypothetical protein
MGLLQAKLNPKQVGKPRRRSFLAVGAARFDESQGFE